jgi:hypothetical protein
MNQFGESQISGTEFFFRVADRLQMDSCLTAVSKEGKSLVLVSPSGELLDHFGAALIRRLKQNLANTPVEVFMPPDSEVMLERFNKLLSSLSLDVATQTRKDKPPESVWVVHDANALGSYEIELLTRLVHQFPGAGISTILMFTSDANPETSICNQGKQFVSWVLEMPTPEQKLSAIQQARKNGNEAAALQFFNRLSRDAAKQMGKDGLSKSDTKADKRSAKTAAPAVKPALKKPASNRKAWPWVLVVSGLLAISVGVAAMLHPELTSQFVTDLNTLFDSKTYEPKVKAKPEAPVQKPAEDTGGPTVVQGEVPTPVAFPPTTPVADPVPPPAAKEELVPTKPEKVVTELPEAAVQGRLWLKGLPEDSFVIEHGTYDSMKQARVSMKDKEWLLNARVVPVYAAGKEEAQFAVVTGPFRTKDRAINTIARLKLIGSASVESSLACFKKSLPLKVKP